LMSQGGAKPADNLPLAEIVQFFQQLRFGNSKVLSWIDAMIFFSSSVSMGCLYAFRCSYVNKNRVSGFGCQA
jgi:hypothetical protein